jgi:radical SAM protein with 4Fe4S-binding SPASM domain
MSWNVAELPQIRQFVESFGQSFRFGTSLAPRLNGDLGPLRYRLPAATIMGLNPDEDASTEDEMEPCSLSSPSEQLYRCGCGTNTIHISAWGELGTCTMQYEHRVSLREYSVKGAIEKVFREVRAHRYRSSSPCRTCDIYSFCDKQPTQARWEAGDAEAPIPYACDVALARAEQCFSQPLVHPLRRVNNERAQP